MAGLKSKLKSSIDKPVISEQKPIPVLMAGVKNKFKT